MFFDDLYSRRLHFDGTTPPAAEEWIWVFGSNLAGRHGKGAALIAVKQFGARYGQGVGLAGDSYAIPTKGWRLEVLDLDTIAASVSEFLFFAQTHPTKKFWVTAIGCGFAGYHASQIAPLFAQAPLNVSLPLEWMPYLE